MGQKQTGFLSITCTSSISDLKLINGDVTENAITTFSIEENL